MKVSLKSITPNIEETIVEIARVSSQRTDKKENPAGLINYLIRNKHWSPFEHGFITMEIVTSKAIGIQLLRHRSFTFQEFSQRYAKVTDIEPIELRRQADSNRQSSTDIMTFDGEYDTIKIDDAAYGAGTHIQGDEAVAYALRVCKNVYEGLIDLGVAKECARMILPMATQTTIFMTGPVRSWIHLINIREDSHAQKEIQEIAREIKRIFIQECPLISEALEWQNSQQD